VACDAIKSLLRNHGVACDDIHACPDLSALLQQAEFLENLKNPQARGASPPAAPPQPPDPMRTGAELCTFTEDLFRRFVHFPSEHYYIAVTLWAIHVHLYSRFKHTPRLLLRSQIGGEAKTLVLDILNQLMPAPIVYAGNITAAAVARLPNGREIPVFLLDEADNLGLWEAAFFRAMINNGYKRGANRVISGSDAGETVRQNLWAPMALACIRNLPGPIMRRSIVVDVRKASKQQIANLMEFDDADPQIKETFELLRSLAAHQQPTRRRRAAARSVVQKDCRAGCWRGRREFAGIVWYRPGNKTKRQELLGFA